VAALAPYGQRQPLISGRSSPCSTMYVVLDQLVADELLHVAGDVLQAGTRSSRHRQVEPVEFVQPTM